MYNYPLMFEKMNNRNSGFVPPNVKTVPTKQFYYWCRSLLQRATSVLEIDVPKEWSGNVKDFLIYCLFRFGFVAVFDREDLGTVFTPATLSGFDFFYQPTNAVIANPALPESLNLKIGEECELLKLCPDYQGIFDIVSYYAAKLATLDGGIDISIINSKFAYFVAAKNKNAAESLKKIFDRVQKGEPAVFFDRKLIDDPASKSEPWQFLERENLKNSYITSEMLQDFQTILNNFDAEIGIPVTPYQKKERMVTSEAEARIIDSRSRSIVWRDTLKESMENVNQMFGLSLSVKLRYEDEEESGEGENEE